MTAVSDPTQRCPKCDEHLPLDAFSPSRQGKQGNWCRACSRVTDKARHAKPLTDEQRSRKASSIKAWQEANPRRVKSYDLKRYYGITLEEYEAKLDEQGGVCAACRQPERRKKISSDELCPLHVDHCHETGRFRGLLCHACNLILGHAKDDPKILLGLLDYIEGWQG